MIMMMMTMMMMSTNTSDKYADIRQITTGDNFVDKNHSDERIWV